jgi:hypothetical protein
VAPGVSPLVSAWRIRQAGQRPSSVAPRSGRPQRGQDAAAVVVN